MAEKLLIIDDEETLRESLKRLFLREGYRIDTAENGEDALKMVEENGYDLIITDIILPGIDGIHVMRKTRQKNPEQLVIVITAFASLETAVEALRAGAYDYIMKPIIHEEIKLIVRNALRQKSLQIENMLLRKQIEREYDFSRIIGQSQEIKRIIGEVKKIADAKSNVLLLGETGTGKELIARAIHFNSSRKDKPFVPINCSTIPDNLLESELFGHVKGAFTGAVSSKKGLFEEANGGTVFLDEIGDISQAFQVKFLRVLEDHEIRPVGGTQSIKVDLRLISATNKNLERAVSNGCFREDLFYRINVINIKLPPLRERKEDIPLLARHFLEKYTQELSKPVKYISDEAMRLLMGYRWSGNIRELQNIIERAVLITESNTIFPEHLSEGLKAEGSFAGDALNRDLSIEGYTRAFILRHQKEYGEQKLADMLGITRKALWEKRKKWGIKRVGSRLP